MNRVQLNKTEELLAAAIVFLVILLLILVLIFSTLYKGYPDRFDPHQQSARDLEKGLRRTDDDVCECIERKDFPF